MDKQQAAYLWFNCCNDVVGCDSDGNEICNLTKLGIAALAKEIPVDFLYRDGNANKVAGFLREFANALEGEINGKSNC